MIGGLPRVPAGNPLGARRLPAGEEHALLLHQRAIAREGGDRVRVPVLLLVGDQQGPQPVELAADARGPLIPEIGIGAVTEDEVLGFQTHQPAERFRQPAGSLDCGDGARGDAPVDLDELVDGVETPARNASEHEDHQGGNEKDLGSESHDRSTPRVSKS